MKIIKNSVAITLALLVSILSVSAVSASDDIKVIKSEKNNVLTSQATSNKIGSLVKKTEIPAQSIAVNNNIPQKYSSVEKGYVTSVKSQKTHNTCWIFSSISTLESALLKKGYGSYDLSEEHLDIWATLRDNNTGWTRSLNGGSVFETSMGYFASWQGARLDSDIPFDYAKDKTFEQVDSIGKTEYGVTDIIVLPNDMDTIKTAVMNYGAVSANFSANSIFFNSSRTATYAYKTFTSTSQIEGHAISIVGWDDNYSKSNFKEGYTPANNGAWLCKNSWGSNYNNIGGYIWISYDDPYLFCDILSAPFAIKDVMKIDDNTKLYQVENYGSMYDFNMYEIDNSGNVKNVEKLTYINKFDFTDKYGNLEKVMFETTSVGADYTVYYIPLDSKGSPSNVEKNWITLTNGTVEYSGYMSVPTNYELPYNKGAIGVRIDGTENSVQSKLGCDEWLQNGSGKMLFIPDTQKDTSYLKYGNTMYELLDFYSDIFGDDTGSNFVIKAITTSDDGVEKFDVNKDGKVSIKDVALTQRYLVGMVDFSRNQIYSADIDVNGSVTLADAVKIQRKLLS